MPSLPKHFEIMVTATLKKTIGSSMLKYKDDYSCLQGRLTAVSNMHFFVPYQIDVVNK